MLVVCEYCSLQFERRSHHARENERLGHVNFCSAECLSKGRCKGQFISCGTCGKEVYKAPSASSKTKSGNLFCSKSCSVSHRNLKIKGPKHPNFAEESSSRYRERALEHYGPSCKVCGYGVLDCLQVHHIDKDRANNSLDNLVVLCPTHHIEVHRGVLEI
jgi:hypothetical protein